MTDGFGDHVLVVVGVSGLALQDGEAGRASLKFEKKATSTHFIFISTFRISVFYVLGSVVI